MTSHRYSRRQLIACGAATGLMAPQLLAADPPAEPFPLDPATALARLKAGNNRFAAGTTWHAHQSANWRKHLVANQQPFATILGCSDSRVPIELVFDQGFGDLFVVRVAGNVIATDVIGSMAYASLHLHTPLFVVLGHAGCGAVTAALDQKLKKLQEPQRIAALLKLIAPALDGLDTTLPYPAQLDAAVEANVRWSLQQLADLPTVKSAIDKGAIGLAGAIYDLASGTVRFFNP